ncbi:MAG: hypothetical protein V4674_01400 [Patescibacteria group bacterium]
MRLNELISKLNVLDVARGMPIAFMIETPAGERKLYGSLINYQSAGVMLFTGMGEPEMIEAEKIKEVVGAVTLPELLRIANEQATADKQNC